MFVKLFVCVVALVALAYAYPEPEPGYLQSGARSFVYGGGLTGARSFGGIGYGSGFTGVQSYGGIGYGAGLAGGRSFGRGYSGYGLGARTIGFGGGYGRSIYG